MKRFLCVFFALFFLFFNFSAYSEEEIDDSLIVNIIELEMSAKMFEDEIFSAIFNDDNSIPLNEDEEEITPSLKDEEEDITPSLKEDEEIEDVPSLSETDSNSTENVPSLKEDEESSSPSLNEDEDSSLSLNEDSPSLKEDENKADFSKIELLLSSSLDDCYGVVEVGTPIVIYLSIQGLEELDGYDYIITWWRAKNECSQFYQIKNNDNKTSYSFRIDEETINYLFYVKLTIMEKPQTLDLSENE